MSEIHISCENRQLSPNSNCADQKVNGGALNSFSATLVVELRSLLEVLCFQSQIWKGSQLLTQGRKLFHVSHAG